MSKTLKIKALDSIDGLIVISADRARDLGIFDKKASFISFGAAKCYVQVRISDKLDYNEMQISHNIMEFLKAPQYLSYEVRYNKDGITLGPSIGILAGKSKKSITPKQLKASLAYVSQYQLLHGAVILFSLDCVNKDNHTIEAYCYNPKNNCWEAGVFPYPSAIYRRLYLSEKWRNHFLEVIGDNLYYNHFFNKWMMYQWFSRSKEMSGYFPKTILYKSSKDIQAMLNKYNKIYVKPIAGQGGKGVIQISHEDGKIIYKYSSKGKNHRLRFDNMTSAIAYGSKLFKREKYILQQPIELIKFQDNILDIRCMMLRDDKNKWECSGIVARVAPKGSIVSNAHSGGTPTSLDILLRKKLGYPRSKFDEIKKNLENISIKAAKFLDDYGIKAAILGIDIGIDTNGKLWIIEINIRYPDLSLFSYVGDYQIVDKAKTSLMLYGKYLAGFGPKT